MRGKIPPQVLEVGCGPHTNVLSILPLIRFQESWLEEPLILHCQELRKTTKRFRFLILSIPVAVATLLNEYQAFPLSEPLEELSLRDESIDLCICIDVLDEVCDTDLCFQRMNRVLKKDGIHILGQDLSNEEDFRICPESWTDNGHPINTDARILDHQLNGLAPIFEKILRREQGRNPRCRYGTYLFAGQESRGS